MTEKSYFALLDQITHRACHLLDRHGRIYAVLIELVNIVGAEPVQGALDRLTDIRRDGQRTTKEMPATLNAEDRTHAVTVAQNRGCLAE